MKSNACEYPQTVSYVLHSLRLEIHKLIEYQAAFDVGNRLIAEVAVNNNIKFCAASVFNTIQDALLYGGIVGSLTRIFDQQSETRKKFSDDKISVERLLRLIKENIEKEVYSKGVLLLAVELSEMYNDAAMVDIRERLLHLRNLRIAHRLDKRVEKKITLDEARRLVEIATVILGQAWLVVEGVNWDFKESRELREKDAEIYWEACAKGLLADV